MTLYTFLILAIIQGLTEFLPVSSSAHLILFPALTGQSDQGLLIDVAVHIGTLGAVIVYFWADVRRALSGLIKLPRRGMTDADSRLALLLIIATIPVIIIGLIFKLTGLDDMLRSITVIAWAMLGFGIVLYLVDQRATQRKTTGDWTLRDAIFMGLWQAVALIPGASRSGMTITGALALGYSREDAAKLAMLMSIPTIIASGALLGADAIGNADYTGLRDGAIAAVFAFGAGLIALRVMMVLLRSISFTPYVIYRIGLGVVLLWMAYS